jgi:hypothetical protein
MVDAVLADTARPTLQANKLRDRLPVVEKINALRIEQRTWRFRI